MQVASREDIPRINAILNAPEVRPHIAPGVGEVDATEIFPRVLFFLFPNGVLMGEGMGGGEYLGLSAFTTKGQGLPSVVAHHQAFDYMFFKTDATRLNATVSRDNEKARRNLKGIGFTRIVDLGNPRIIASLDWDDWALQSKEALRTSSEFAWANSLPEHERRVLGAFALTVRGGWPGKAVAQFNKYAHLNHLSHMRVMSDIYNVFSYNDNRFVIMDNIIE